MPLRFFYNNQLKFDETQRSFFSEGLQLQIVFITFLSMKQSSLLTVEIILNTNNFCNFCKSWAIVSNFRCLIMATTKLMSYVYITSFFYK